MQTINLRMVTLPSSCFHSFLLKQFQKISFQYPTSFQYPKESLGSMIYIYPFAKSFSFKFRGFTGSFFYLNQPSICPLCISSTKVASNLEVTFESLSSINIYVQFSTCLISSIFYYLWKPLGFTHSYTLDEFKQHADLPLFLFSSTS